MTNGLNNSKRSKMKEFVLYPEALALKELGFDEPCFGYYEDTGLTITFPSTSENGWKWVGNSIIPTKNTSAPLYSQAFRFFRDKYNINTVISWRDDLLNYDISLTEMKKHGYFYYKDNFTTYEEAELQCLQHLIKIVN